MSAPLQNVTIAAMATLLAAATLVALHRLRAQPIRRPVATLLFWHAATREQTSRVRWGRFSQLATFLSLLAILGLLGAALSGARGGAASRAPRVLVIDAGYAMSAVDDGSGRTRGEEASALAKSAADGRPLAIIEAGDVPRLLASFDDPPIAARRAIDTIRPTSRPADRAGAIRLAANLLSRDGGEVILYTDRPLPRERLPNGIDDVLRVRTVGGGPVRNRAIVSAIYSPNPSNAGSGSLVIRTIAPRESPRPPRVRLSITSNDHAAAQVAERDATPAEGGEAVATFDDLVADGRIATVELTEGDAIAADDRVTLRLPTQRPIAFDLAGPPLPAPLAAALSALGTADADASATTIAVATVDAQSPLPTGRPIIALVRGDGVAASARVEASDDELIADLDFEGAVVGRGAALAPRAATPLLRVGDVVVAAIERGAGETRLLLSDALFAEGSTLSRRPAFLLMIARAVRSMAGWTDAPLNLALDRQVQDPAWPGGRADDSVAWIAGSRPNRDVATTRPTFDEPPTVGNARGIGRVWVLALAGAIALLMVEGLLYATKRIV